MTHRRLLILLAMAVGLVSAAEAQAAPACTSKAVERLERRLPVTPYTVPGSGRLGQRRCFDFDDDGRRDVVFTGWEAMNHGAHYWAAFRATKRDWVRERFRRACCRSNPRFGIGLSIRRAGSDLVVRQPVYFDRDPACCPSGGMKSGRWRWRTGRLRLVDVNSSTASSSAVRDCHTYAYYPNVLVSSVRNMSCGSAKRDLRRYAAPIKRRFRTPGGFRCRRVSGSRLGGQWRCVNGSRAYRFDFGD